MQMEMASGRPRQDLGTAAHAEREGKLRVRLARYACSGGVVDVERADRLRALRARGDSVGARARERRGSAGLGLNERAGPELVEQHGGRDEQDE